jgi:hypothetical protein
MNAHAVESKVPAAGHQPPAAEQHLSSEAPTTKQDDLIGKVATVAVIGLGVALIEVELIPGLILGAAAAFLPNLMPSLRPAMKSTVRASYKFAQKTREVFAEASEQVQDMVAEAKLEQEPAAQAAVDGARKPAAAARKASA